MKNIFKLIAFLLVITAIGFLGFSSPVVLASQPIDQLTAENVGQCWGGKGGTPPFIKNSCPKEECKELGGKSWCLTAGGCENI